MIVRIARVVLKNFKNVEFGEMLFPNYSSVKNKGEITKSDITGIYGQNGSGKTAMVEALDVLKRILSGNSVPTKDYIGIINEDASILVEFFLDDEKEKFKVEYEVKLQTFEKTIGIPSESLTFWTRGSGWKGKQCIKVNNPYYEGSSIASDVQAKADKSGDAFDGYDFIDNPDKLAVFCASHQASFFFNSSVGKVLCDRNTTDNFRKVVLALRDFAERQFFVIRVNQLAVTNSQSVIPLNVYHTDKDCVLCGCLPLFINGAGTMPKDLYPSFLHILDSINTALCAIVPDLTLEPSVISEESTPDGKESVYFEMYSVRGGKKFSTRYESEGIKRIISLLSCLTSAFNNPGFTLVVDELDSGIFEYLLGELLFSIDREARGQLIFTSHNLRAFERLSNHNIYCSTVNPRNRYVKLSGIQKNNNKRDLYIRSLVLGGQAESLYSSDDLDNIGYALRKAGHGLKVNNEEG